MWLGKLNYRILGTSSGVVAVRSVRRLFPERQADSKILKNMRGSPWQPGNEVRHRVTPEVSHAGPVPLLAAAAAGGPAYGAEIAISRPHFE